MIGSEEQQKEPDCSGCAFLGQQPDPVKEVDEEGSLPDATNSGSPRSWTYKSFGLQECYQCYLFETEISLGG